MTNILLAALLFLSATCVNIGCYALGGLALLLISIGISGIFMAYIIDNIL